MTSLQEVGIHGERMCVGVGQYVGVGQCVGTGGCGGVVKW